MEYVIKSFNHGETVLNDASHKTDADSLFNAIKSISDADIRSAQTTMKRKAKSLSETINKLLKERLVAAGWTPEAPIFQDPDYRDKKWRLDFAKGSISVEVAFNHGEAIAWNLLKPVLASQQNHVKKEIQTDCAIMICATAELKAKGGFDSAVGEFEKVERYLVPLSHVLTVPIMIIGLKPPKTFYLKHSKENGKKIGLIEDIIETVSELVKK